MSLNVFLQQQFLIEATAAHCALVSEFIVHLSVLVQMHSGQELFLALAASERKVNSVLA